MRHLTSLALGLQHDAKKPGIKYFLDVVAGMRQVSDVLGTLTALCDLQLRG